MPPARKRQAVENSDGRSTAVGFDIDSVFLNLNPMNFCERVRSEEEAIAVCESVGLVPARSAPGPKCRCGQTYGTTKDARESLGWRYFCKVCKSKVRIISGVSAVDAYGLLISQHASNDVMWLQTHVFERLARQGETPQQRRVGAYQIAGQVDVFSKRLLLVPTCIRSHWALVAVDHTAKTVSYYDSLNNCGRNATLAVRDFIKYVGSTVANGVNVDAYTVRSRTVGIPRQTNSYDCGVFTLVYADCLARRVRMVFGQSDIANYRMRMAYELLKKQYLDRI
jgi:hypothetical protein